MFCSSEFHLLNSVGVRLVFAVVCIVSSSHFFSLVSAKTRVSTSAQVWLLPSCAVVSLLALLSAPNTYVLLSCLCVLFSVFAFALCVATSTCSTFALSSGVTLLGLVSSQLVQSALGLFLSLEIISVAALLLTSAETTQNNKHNILAYYWVAALCAITFTATCALTSATLSPISDQVSLALTSLVFLVAVSAKLGAMPAGVWVVWFYEGLSTQAFVTYVSSIYPVLVLVVVCFTYKVFALIPCSSSVVYIVTLATLCSAIFFVTLRGLSTMRAPALLVILTSVTFVFICASWAL